MQKIMVIGNLGGDPETRTGKNDKEFYTAKIAVNNYVGGENTTVWYSLIFGDSFKKRVAVMSKGMKLFIEGKPDFSTYKNKDDETKVDQKIYVGNVEILSKIEKESGGGEEEEQEQSGKSGKGKTSKKQETVLDEEDDLPF